MIGGIVSHINQQSYSKDAILSTNYADDYEVRGATITFNIVQEFYEI